MATLDTFDLTGRSALVTGAASGLGLAFAEALAEAGVPLTLSSDSHAPHHVGRHFAIAVEGLRRIGVKEVMRFEKRQRIAVPLTEAVPA